MILIYEDPLESRSPQGLFFMNVSCLIYLIELL